MEVFCFLRCDLLGQFFSFAFYKLLVFIKPLMFHIAAHLANVTLVCFECAVLM